MNIIKLSNELLLNIYKEKLIHEFQEEEIKPYEIIEKLVKDGKYIGYALYDEDKLASYAFLCKPTNGDYLLLDYYVVEGEFRSKGYESKFINILKEKNKDYKGIIAEVEDPEFAVDEIDLKNRNKRIKFYEKNNAYHTNVKASVFGSRYIIMIISENHNFTDEIIVKELKNIYNEILGKENTNKYIEINNLN